MAKYVVSYDLKSGQDYEPLYAVLRSFVDWSHPVESVWIVESPLTADQVASAVWAKMWPNDKLVVVALSRGWQAYNMAEDVAVWMRRAL